MRFYEESLHRRFDYAELLTLVRGGFVYSINVKKDNQGFYAQVELVTRADGIQSIELFNSAHRSFPTKQEVLILLTEALATKLPRVFEKHLADYSGKKTLCGQAIDGENNFKAASVKKFYASGDGPRCSRCVTQGFVFGIKEPE